MTARPPAPAAFDSFWTSRDLLDAIEALAPRASPDDPAVCSQSAFDQQARASDEFRGLPSAKRIVVRIAGGLGWKSLLALVFDADVDAARSLALRAREDWPPLDDDGIRHALRAVARHLGVKELSYTAYTRGREQILAGDQRRWAAGPTLWLPSAEQVAAAAGGWPRAIEIAGLKASSAATARGIDWVTALGRCLEEHGALPNGPELQAFAKAHGFPLARRAASLEEVLAEFRRNWAAQGRWAPDASLPERDRPDFAAVPRDGGRWAGGRRKKRWTREEVIESLIVYLDDLAATEWPDARHYQVLAIGRPELASIKTVAGFGEFEDLLAEARRARRRRRATVG